MNRFVRQLSHSSFDCRQLFSFSDLLSFSFSCNNFFEKCWQKGSTVLLKRRSCSPTLLFYFIISGFLLFKPRLKEQKAEKEKLARNFLSLFSPLDQNKSETSSFFSSGDHNRSKFEKKNEPVDSYFRFALVFK